ncbi:hypothetical protein PGT21_036096 [Puccinia graminis f. sp. tritici]|uniref:RING-type domain-containing protein n=1 Tax=Puccinia graminis f. sp. tritici TaxID=56615 RepID=A0A5B0NQQ6_PUCGR|nr:hypothetical protein PGT21_035504 [Puccinia graminis f. sp. tritici]KAA1111058.1 hypothetical protein PGT21_036096 [Puccinia graminis f. sp. tritici]
MKCSATAWLWAALMCGALLIPRAAGGDCPRCNCAEAQVDVAIGRSACPQEFICEKYKVFHSVCETPGVTTEKYKCPHCKLIWYTGDCPWEKSTNHQHNGCPTNGDHSFLERAPSSSRAHNNLM